MNENIFTEISILLALSASIAIIMRALKQPLIMGYIITGILVGPSLLGVVNSPGTIEVFGKFGIALLLFIVGLGLNPQIIKEVGKVSLITCLGQVLFTSLLGFGIVRYLGYGVVTSLYIAVALSFSSTIIILKLLTDKKENHKLYGKISIGVLLLQDLLAIFALVIAAAMGNNGISYVELGELVSKGVAVGIGIILISHFLLKPMTAFLSRSQELLFIFALAWGLALSTLFLKLGFSLEIGALVGGVALSNMTYAREISSRLRPLRDFFVIVFFIAIGAQLDFNNLGTVIFQAIGLSAFVLIGKPIIMTAILGFMGHTRKTSFKTGLAVAQISEFSLIFILLGKSNGQVSNEVVSLVTMVGIITIALSSYMIIFSDGIYLFFEKYIKLFERKKVIPEHETKHVYDAVLFGYKKGGSEFIKVFDKLTKRYIVVDYDPDVIDELDRKNARYLYGDATDLELLDEIDLSKARLIVSLITDYPTNLFLLEYLGQVSPHAVIICHADSAKDAAKLYGIGASYVLMPAYIGNEKIGTFIRKNGFNKTEFKHYREKHIHYLQSHYELLSDIEI